MRAARLLSCFVWMVIALALPHMGRGAIFNWQTAQVIPGTELIQPEPFMFLGDWNTEQRNLRYADFSSLDIKRSGVKSVWLENARFHGTDLSSTAFLDVQLDNAVFPLAKILGASFEKVDFTGADFTAADLSRTRMADSRLNGANFSVANLQEVNFDGSTFEDAKFDNALIHDANLTGATERGFTARQLYATSSYKSGDLRGLQLRQNDLTGWDFSRQNLRRVQFQGSNLTDAYFAGSDLGRQDFSSSLFEGAVLTATRVVGAQFPASASWSQIALSQSYLDKDLRGLGLPVHDLSGANLADCNLSGANLRSSKFIGTNLMGANLAEADLSSAVGLEQAQFSAATTYTDATLWPVGFDPAKLGLTKIEMMRGDYNSDLRRDELDLLILQSVINNKSGDPWTPFGSPDLNRNGRVDFWGDLVIWVEDLQQTWFGDANWDGEFNSADFVFVWQAGQYEDAIVGNSNWATGDWDGDGEFNSSDLVLVFNVGAYERGPRPKAALVPEPYGIHWIGLLVLVCARGWGRWAGGIGLWARGCCSAPIA